MGGWIDGLKAVLRTACSNKKFTIFFINLGTNKIRLLKVETCSGFQNARGWLDLSKSPQNNFTKLGHFTGFSTRQTSLVHSIVSGFRMILLSWSVYKVFL